MFSLKHLIAACLAVLLAAPAFLLTSCSSGTVTEKPAGLPELIAFTSNRSKAVAIFTIKPDGTALTSLSSDNRSIDMMPAWSPDSTRMSFSSNRSDNFEIWTMDAEGGNRQRLTDRRIWNGLPGWSPDGGKIVFVGQVRNAAGLSDMEIFVINADGSDLRQLTDSSTFHVETGHAETGEAGHSHHTGWNSVPAWSPDGSKILFSSNRDGNPVTPILYTMNPDGSGQQKFGLFTDVDGSDPDWSAANNRIVLARGTAAKRDIWVMDGGSPFPLLTAKKLTDNIDNNHNPKWSPDGRQIAFVSDTHGSDDVFIMNADGSNVRRLTYDESVDDFPAWRQ